MQLPHSQKVMVYGHDKDDPDCQTPDTFRHYITNIFAEHQGRYRHTIGKDADAIILSLGGLAYGQFNVGRRVKPNDDDRKAFGKVEYVYPVDFATLYEIPVRLWDHGVKAIHIGPQIKEGQFQAIKAASGESRVVSRVESPTDDPFAVPMLFLRIGWMRFYEGLSDDDQIHGGGAFVREHGYGHEMFNFLPFNGRMYGYVRPTGGGADSEFVDGAGIKLERVVTAAKRDRELPGVLVVWVSSPPEGGTFIVGWYRNATVCREHQSPPNGSNRDHKGEQFGYYVSAAAEDIRRLEATARNFPFPYIQKDGWGIGQSNVWYADKLEQSRALRLSVLRYIESGQLPEIEKLGPSGTPRQPDPLLRCKVEKAAIDTTTAHFRNQGYTVDSHEKDNVGWDLLATFGNRQLRLEVKGLAGSETCIELTPNEYAQMRKWQDTYHVCIVTDALTDPKLAVFSYSAESGKWQDDQKRTLRIAEIVGARCRLD
jgi:hypothetical protein